METSKPKTQVRLTVDRVELVDLTVFDGQNITIKEGKPFKVILSFDKESRVLRVHFLEVPPMSNSSQESCE